MSKPGNERCKTLIPVQLLACSMDQALFGGRSTVQGILSLTWGKRGGVNCIKLSCARGRVIVDSLLRDKSFILQNQLAPS